MSELQALLFDVDGTLADTERDAHRPAFNKAFAEFGLDWVWDVDLYGELLAVSGGKERMRHYIQHYRQGQIAPDKVDALVTALYEVKTRHYTAALADGSMSLRPGVRRLIAEARAAGLRMAIVTTTSHENVAALLRHSLAPDAESWFELIAAGDIVSAKKPAPDIYCWALRVMDIEPEHCLALEDSSNGLRASLGAGISTVVTVNGYTAGENFDGAIVVLSDLGEPDAPFTVLRGDTVGGVCVNVDLLRRWMAG